VDNYYAAKVFSKLSWRYGSSGRMPPLASTKLSSNSSTDKKILKIENLFDFKIILCILTNSEQCLSLYKP
jgi:hypothetical protein